VSRGKRIQIHNCRDLNYLLVCEVVRQPLFKNVTDQIRRFRLPPRGDVLRVYAGEFQTAIFPKQMQTPMFSLLENTSERVGFSAGARLIPSVWSRSSGPQEAADTRIG
jgi:hypothetical protein